MKHHSRKLKLSPVQREILWLLREAGGETVPHTLNYLHGEFPGVAWRELMQQVEEAVRGLLDLGLVSFWRHIDKERGGYTYLPLEAVEVPQALSFQENYVRRSQARDWPNNGSWIELVITDAGERALYE